MGGCWVVVVRGGQKMTKDKTNTRGVLPERGTSSRFLLERNCRL